MSIKEKLPRSTEDATEAHQPGARTETLPPTRHVAKQFDAVTVLATAVHVTCNIAQSSPHRPP